MPDKKIAAITDFLVGLAEIRKAVKEDAKKLLAAIPQEILLDQESLSAYLEEMTRVIARKYLITEDNKRVVPATATLINNYVNAMLKGK